MKVLIACSEFTTLSGAPMFVYELGKELVRRGHEVIVASGGIGGIMKTKAAEAGIICMNTAKTGGQNPDVLHVQGMGPSHWAVNAFSAPAVATVHSQLVYEVPLIHPSVRHYACVRPQIMETIVNRDGVDWKKVSVVFNGVDMERFRPGTDKFDTPTILVAGTVDYLRAQAAHKTWDIAKDLGWEVLFVGRKMSGHLDDLPPHVHYQEGDEWAIEEILRKCSATSGILLGRTLLEGWACGLPGYVFEIDTEGVVQSWGLYDPPPPQLMALFDIKYMAGCYERLYERVQ